MATPFSGNDTVFFLKLLSSLIELHARPHTHKSRKTTNPERQQIHPGFIDSSEKTLIFPKFFTSNNSLSYAYFIPNNRLCFALQSIFHTKTPNKYDKFLHAFIMHNCRIQNAAGPVNF